MEQEPELLPCHASASPLSPQLSDRSTPRLCPSSVEVSDPYNELAPPPPSHTPHQFRCLTSLSLDEAHTSITDLYLICHGECHMNLRPDLIAGRCPEAALTPNGKRQARALAVFLKSQGVRFNAVYSSPLDRARATAHFVCQELNFSEEQIHSSDALTEMSQGHWEGCYRSEVFTADALSRMESFRPDFCAPSGESLRQVEFRMIEFLNGIISSLPPDLTEFPGRNSRPMTNSIHERDRPPLQPPPPPQRDHLLHRHRQGLARKKSGKSRLQIVIAGDNEADDEMSPRPPAMNQEQNRKMNQRSHPPPPPCTPACVAVFTHSVPIKCVLTAILGCSAAMTQKICLEESSVTVLQHSWKKGWQIKRVNDIAHLRLL